MKIKLSDLWRWSGTIDRAQYLLLGGLLFVVKFNLDRGISWWMGKPWSIIEYLRATQFGVLPTSASGMQLGVLLAVSLPFLWAGSVLSVRRLRSAGLPLWLVALFVVPIVKLIFFTILCLVPTREKSDTPPSLPGRPVSWLDRIIPEHPLGSAAMGILVTLMMTLLVTWLGMNVLQDYGWSLFIGLPFCMGFFSVLIYGFHRPRTFGKCLSVAFFAVMLTGVGLLLFAFEGVLCLIMAAPLAIVMALIGGAIAYAVQSAAHWRAESPKLYCSMLLLMPLAMGFEHYERLEPPLLKVTSLVEVNAPVETVWRNVVTFSELPPPRECLFHCGIAYSLRAEIKGQGVGAIRYCVFSTGPFVEPIEVWDEPNLLKFSVTKNPSPMQEISPYQDLHPPHLEGFLVSKMGQFRLVRLPGGRTMLEGTTWYRHNLWPAEYWQLWSDYIIHQIHLRVLNHVKQLSEAAQNSK